MVSAVVVATLLLAAAAAPQALPNSVKVTGPEWSCTPNGSAPCTGNSRWLILAPTYQYLDDAANATNVTNVDVLLPETILGAAKEGRDAASDPSAFASVKSLLLVLPVAQGPSDGKWGEGMSVLKELNYHNTENSVIVTPRFSTTPWYCDGEKNTNRTRYPVRHDAYLREVVVPLMQQKYCPGMNCPVDLLGFSKSGWGALSLLMRNSAFYRNAVAWDTPSMLSGEYCKWLGPRDMWDMLDQFGTCNVWEAYSPYTLVADANVTRHFQSSSRIFLSGQHYFGSMASADGAPGSPFNHTVDMHARMNGAGILHAYNDRLDPGKHEWSKVWIQPGLAFLANKSGSAAPLTSSATIGGDGAGRSNSGLDALAVPSTPATTEETCRVLSVGVRTLGFNKPNVWYSGNSMPLIGMIEAARVFPALEADSVPFADAILDSFLAPNGAATRGIAGAPWGGPACDYNGVPPVTFVVANRSRSKYPRDAVAVSAFTNQSMMWPTRLPGGAVARDNGDKWHPNPPSPSNNRTVITWPDDTFMCTATLSHAAVYAASAPAAAAALPSSPSPLNSTALLEEAARRLLAVYHSGQRDSAVDGLLHHGYDAASGARSCCKWGDGNGWTAMAMADALMGYHTLQIDTKRRKLLAEAFVQFAGDLVEVQNATSGLWHQLLNDTTTFQCSSATGFNLHALAVGLRIGVLPHDPFASAITIGWAGLQTFINKTNGFVSNLSPGFGINADRQEYLDGGGSFNWGYGAVVRACASIGSLEASVRNIAKYRRE